MASERFLVRMMAFPFIEMRLNTAQSSGVVVSSNALCLNFPRS